MNNTVTFSDSLSTQQKELSPYRVHCMNELYESLDAFVIGIGEQASEPLKVMNELQRAFIEDAELDGTDAAFVSEILNQSNIISLFLARAVEHWQHLEKDHN